MSSISCTRRVPISERFATPFFVSARARSCDLRLAPAPNGPGALYFVLAAVGVFTLLVGGAVRLRRPRDPATLHFFWLAVAFFGVFTFSFSGRLDRLDWVFYWADAISMLALPPLFLHFTQVFPERRPRWTRGPVARARCGALYVPALAIGTQSRLFAIAGSARDPQVVRSARVCCSSGSSSCTSRCA